MYTFGHGKNRSEDENADGQARHREANEQRHDQTPHRHRSTEASAHRRNQAATGEGHATGHTAQHAQEVTPSARQLEALHGL